jgi:predicted transcriptional regulator
MNLRKEIRETLIESSPTMRPDQFRLVAEEILKNASMKANEASKLFAEASLAAKNGEQYEKILMKAIEIVSDIIHNVGRK